MVSGVAYVDFALVDRAAHPDAQAAAQRAFQGLLELVTAGQKAGILRGNDPLTSARVACSMVHGLAALAIERQFTFRGRVQNTAPRCRPPIATAACPAPQSRSSPLRYSSRSTRHGQSKRGDGTTRRTRSGSRSRRSTRTWSGRPAPAAVKTLRQV